MSIDVQFKTHEVENQPLPLPAHRRPEEGDDHLLRLQGIPLRNRANPQCCGQQNRDTDLGLSGH